MSLSRRAESSGGVTMEQIKENPSAYVENTTEEWREQHPEMAVFLLTCAPGFYEEDYCIPDMLKQDDTIGLRLAKVATDGWVSNVDYIQNKLVLHKLIEGNLWRSNPKCPFFHYITQSTAWHNYLEISKQRNDKEQTQVELVLLRECVPLLRGLENLAVFATNRMANVERAGVDMDKVTWKDAFDYQQYMILCYLDCIQCAVQVTKHAQDGNTWQALFSPTDGILPLLEQDTRWFGAFIGTRPTRIPELVAELLRFVHLRYK